MNSVLLLLSPLFAIVSGLTLWPGNTVPFYCDKAFNYEQCQRIREAAQEIQSHTCINFLEKPFGNQPNWIHITAGQGCYTSVGMQWGATFLSLGKGCHQKNTIIHELFHALGIRHMHQRRDRDQHITVNWWMIAQRWQSQFMREMTHYDVGMPYDYSSTMHYGNLGGAMAPKDADYSQFLGNARGGSFYDYHTVNRLYGCYDKCPGESFLECRNGGIPNPRDCSKCNCPSGYIGDFCDKKPPTVAATSRWQRIQMSSPSLPQDSYHRKENILWIVAPRFNKVEVRVIRMGMYSNQEYLGNCEFYGLEIKTPRDYGLGGPIVCNPKMTNRWHIYRSHWNLLPLVAYNGLKGQQYYEVEYRYV